MDRVLAQDSLEIRVARIERQHRQARRLLFVLAMLVVLLVAMEFYGERGAAATSEPGPLSNLAGLPEGRFSSVTTRSLQIDDDRGNHRALMSISKELHGGGQPVVLSLIDESGEERLELESGGAFGPALNVSRTGVGSVRVAVKDSTPYVQLVDDKGKVGAVLWFMNGSPHLVMSDEEGKTRAIFGFDAGWPGSKTPSTIVLYDKTGKAIWSATQEEAKK